MLKRGIFKGKKSFLKLKQPCLEKHIGLTQSVPLTPIFKALCMQTYTARHGWYLIHYPRLILRPLSAQRSAEGGGWEKERESLGTRRQGCGAQRVYRGGRTLPPPPPLSLSFSSPSLSPLLPLSALPPPTELCTAQYNFWSLTRQLYAGAWGSCLNWQFRFMFRKWSIHVHCTLHTVYSHTHTYIYIYVWICYVCKLNLPPSLSLAEVTEQVTEHVLCSSVWTQNSWDIPSVVCLCACARCVGTESLIWGTSYVQSVLCLQQLKMSEKRSVSRTSKNLFRPAINFLAAA